MTGSAFYLKVLSMDADCRACTSKQADIRQPDVYEQAGRSPDCEYISMIA